MMMNGVTGSLMYTLVPGRRRRKWINLYRITDEEVNVTPSGIVTPSGTLTPSGVDTMRNVNFGNAMLEDDYYADNLAAYSLQGTNSLHIVYFVRANDEDASVDVNALHSGLYMLQTRYSDINLHQYPYADAEWPAPLIANIRDACLLSQDLPEGYREDDVLLFVHKPKDIRSYEITGHALACVLAAGEKGSSFGLLQSLDNVMLLKDAISEKPPQEGGEGEESKAEVNTSSYEGTTFKNMTLAFTCRFVSAFANDVLRVIADHVVDPDDPCRQDSDYKLLDTIVSTISTINEK